VCYAFEVQLKQDWLRQFSRTAQEGLVLLKILKSCCEICPKIKKDSKEERN
jgi:hypothetical protein